MKDQINTIRRAVEAALSDDQPYIEACKQSLTALSELERMAVEPVAWTSQIEIDWAKRNPGRAGSFYAVKEGPSSLPLYTAAPPAQQPQAEKPLAPLEPATSYVQPVPDHCDRIVWRNHYYHLPLKQPQAEAVPSDVVRDAERLDWLLMQVSGKEFRRIGVEYSGNCNRSAIDAAIAQQKGGQHDRT